MQNDAILEVYSRPQCPNCTRLKKWLGEKKIPYNEINVDEDRTAFDTLVSKGYASLPVVSINSSKGSFEASGFTKNVKDSILELVS